MLYWSIYMEIISISGLDGSGKSTQTQLLRQHLENAGQTVFYFHAVQFSIANILNHKNTINHVSTNSHSDSKKCSEQTCLFTTQDVTKASWTKIQLRKIALFIDVHRFKLLIRKLEKENYNYILTDRYFYDMIINISYLSQKNYTPLFFSHITIPDYRFYLSVNPDNIMNRDNAPSQGIDYLNKKKNLFEKNKSKFDLQEINGNREKKEIFEKIKQLVH